MPETVLISPDPVPARHSLTLRERLSASPAWIFILYVSFSSFMVYSWMYGFRKPFTAASYDSFRLFGISYKVVLVISLVIGYMCSKFYGIRFIATMQPSRRGGYIIRLVVISWIALLFFGLVPMPYNFIFMFINGLPLGMVWGLVFSFLEGRRVTELMGAILATSFIFASGLAKTVGKGLILYAGVTEQWMPFVAGGFFIIPLLLGTFLLKQTPPPTAEDIAQRTIRLPMGKQQRKEFLGKFGLALIPVIIAYVMLTILRDFCEDFANELWAETGFLRRADVFASTSTIVSLIVLAVVGGFFLIRNNYKAFQMNNVIIIAGFILTAAATFVYHLHFLSPVVWMIIATSGLYLGYVPYNCFYFERMLAAYKVPGNVGFFMYLADAFGYMGTVVVLLIKEFVKIRYSWVDFFTMLFYVAAAGGILLVLWGAVLFERIHKKTI